ncbi:MAG: hypothetical protein ACKOXF_06760 [Chitinophagaceae bacterium]
MKYIKQLFSLAILAILFSSCGSLSISQKRYSNGLNISWFSGKDEVKATPIKKKKQEALNSVASNNDIKEIVHEPVVLTEELDEHEILQSQVAESDFTIVSSEQHLNKVNLNKVNKTEKGENKIKKINNLKKAIQLTKVQESNDGGGALKTIGWIFIILGIIFILIVSILIGVLFMLLGLLFVIAGK